MTCCIQVQVYATTALTLAAGNVIVSGVTIVNLEDGGVNVMSVTDYPFYAQLPNAYGTYTVRDDAAGTWDFFLVDDAAFWFIATTNYRMNVTSGIYDTDLYGVDDGGFIDDDTNLAKLAMRWRKVQVEDLVEEVEPVVVTADAWNDLDPYSYEFDTDVTKITSTPGINTDFDLVNFCPAAEEGEGVGVILRADDGIFRVTAATETELTLEVLEEPKRLINESNGSMGLPINVRQWTLDTPTDTIYGLWHLEGETVNVLGDGDVFTEIVVTDGKVVLPNEVTRAHVGLPYTCRARTLPLTSSTELIEGRRRRVVGVATRYQNSKGALVGRTLDELYPVKEHTIEDGEIPNGLINGTRYNFVSTNWDANGQTYFVQEDPVPATILSVVQEIEVGDEQD